MASAPAEQTLKVSRSAHLAVSADGSRLLVGPLYGQHDADWNEQIPVYRVFDLRTLAPITDLDAQWNRATVVRFSPSGEHVVMAGNAGDLLVWDAATGLLVAKWVAHQWRILDLSFRDENIFMISGIDGVTRLWKFALATSPMIATVALIEGKYHAIVTPDGCYTEAKKALTKIAFRKQLQGLTTFEQYDLWMNRPDIVLQRLRALTPQRAKVLQHVVKKRFARRGLSEQPIRFWSTARSAIKFTQRPDAQT